MKKNKQLIFVISVILLTMFFFMYAVTITWDSAHYMTYVNILEGVLPFNNWDVVRGPVFPVMIYLSNLVFGKTVQGLLMFSYSFYLIMLLFAYKILKDILPDNKRKYKIIIFTLLSIIFNPIIFGYYHVLLTEFVAMTLAVLYCYLAYKWINADQLNIKKTILYTIVFALLTVISWFLKQPYVSVALFPLLIALVIKILKKENIKQKLISVGVFIVCFISLVISISCWNNVLESKGLNTSTDRNPTTTLGNSFIEGLNCFEIIYGDEFKLEEKSKKYFSNSEIKKIEKHIKNKDTSYIILNVKKDNKIIETNYIDVSSNNLSTFESIKLLLKNIISHPILVIDSYLTNYLSIIDIYRVECEDGTMHEPTKIFDLKFVNELSSIGMKPYSYTSNIFYITDEAYDRVVNYEQFNQAPKLLNYGMIILSKVAILLFKIIFIILPIGFIFSIIKRITTKNNKYDMVIILFGFSLLHLLLHVVTGAIIDRYAMPAYIPTFLGTILFVNLLIKKKEVKKNGKSKNINHNTSL